VTRRLLATALLLAAVASPARASEFWSRADQAAESAPPDQKEELIARASELGIVAAKLATKAVVAHLNGDPIGTVRLLRAEMRAQGERAVALLERALELDPDDASVHYALAQFYFEFLFGYYDDDLPMHNKRDEIGMLAVEHWNKFEELAPLDPRQVNFVSNRPMWWRFVNSPQTLSPISGATNQIRGSYQFQRSIVHTKIGGDENWAKAIEDYDYCLALAPDDTTLLTNAAEILMALGRLDESIELYERAVDYLNDPLFLYGLAVAYDRKGSVERARDTILTAVEIERNTPNTKPMAALDKETVFFIPNGDVHYYKGLAFEALGETKLALLHYREFLRAVPDTKYAEQARQHIDALANGGKSKRR